MNHAWKDDPRVKAMDPKKVDFLTELAEQIGQTPRHRMMNRFLSVSLEARRNGITFSDQETEVLTAVLAESMDPADRAKIDLLRTLSRRIGN